MMKVSEDIRDFKHKWENVSQALNIFKRVREKGATENQFVESIWRVRGLTLEIINVLERPGAYFFSVLKDKWSLT